MPTHRRRSLGLAAALWSAACLEETVEPQGQFGRPIPLATGDGSALPRLAFIDEGCPADAPPGGCPGMGPDGCRTLLVDSLAPLTALRDPDRREGSGPALSRECLALRAAGGLAAPEVSSADLAAAVTRFRFADVPLLRAPAAGENGWTWTAGDEDVAVEPGGVLGGNVLRQFAIRIRDPVDDPPTLTFYGEFPGTETDLADQGRAFLPLQFPGRLLGRDVGDHCDIGGSDCSVGGFDLSQSREQIALEPTRMVMDACIASPPCAVRWDQDPFDAFAIGECRARQGPDADTACVPPTDPARGGRAASLVVATGVPGLVLFDDSATRMFGDLQALPDCTAVDADTRACLESIDGVLRLSGWPPAGEDHPLVRLRVRSLALVPGLTRTRGIGACERLERRQTALLRQCTRFRRALQQEGDIRDTTPPYSGTDDDADGESHEHDIANSSIAVLGETQLGRGTTLPDPTRWISVLVLPHTHPLPLSLRRDVAPEAIQPDGLVGTVLFERTDTILDYTDQNPGLRMSCLDPREGQCLVAPDCQVDGQRACCFGLPLNLLVDFIVDGEDDTCCAALSAAELEEIKGLGRCRGTAPT